MGQPSCCGADRSDQEFIMHLNGLPTEDPVESETPKQARSSVKQTTLLSRRGFKEGVDGDFIQEDPMITEFAYVRVQGLEQINIPECYFEGRGTKTLPYFRFRRSGVIYEGEWRNEVPHGLGKNYYPNGGVYEGSFVDGVPHGYGRFIMPNGDYYQGEVKFGRANGTGLYQTDTSIYRGQFKDNSKHGQGQQKSESLFFKGEHEYGERKSGLLNFNGSTYEGSFVDGLFSGKAKLTTSIGNYSGNFKEGKQHGYGEFRWLDNSMYRGEYYRGEREGYGEYFNGKNSSISKGVWKKGVLEGEGSYTEPMGETYKCIWSAGKICAIIEK